MLGDTEAWPPAGWRIHPTRGPPRPRVSVPHRSSGVSTWKVRSMTVVHCRQRMMKVLGLGRSVFIS